MIRYVFLLSFASFIYGGTCLLLSICFRRKVRLFERLSGIRNLETEGSQEEEKENKKGIIHLPKMFVPEGLKSAILLSGLDIRVDDFVFVWIFVALIPPSLAYMLSENVLLSIAVLILFSVAPMILLKVLGGNQVKEFEKQLGDALTIVSNGLRAGHSLPQALVSVTETLPDPVKREFLTASREIKLGTPVTDALRNVAGRMKSKDLLLLITAIEVQQRVGGNLSEIMDTISRTIRDRLKMKRNISSMTAQGKISGLVVGLLPVISIAVISVASPGYTDPLFQTTVGKIILAVCAVMEVIGYYFISKIVNIRM